MAIKVIKLITKETIISDIYSSDELYSSVNIDKSKEPIYILLDPVEICYDKNKRDLTLKILFFNYLPYSEDGIAYIDIKNVMMINNPKENILISYKNYITALKQENLNLTGSNKNDTGKEQEIDSFLKSFHSKIKH